MTQDENTFHSFQELSHPLSNSPQPHNHEHNKMHGRSSPARSKQPLSNLSLQNVTDDTISHKQLPTPTSSQSADTTYDHIIYEPRLPISPPPEEEIRVRESSVYSHGHISKQKSQSRLPIPASRDAPSASFKFPSNTESFSRRQQKVLQSADGPPSVSTEEPPTFTSNSRKRGRSAVPPPVVPSSGTAPFPSDANSKVTPVTQSPNPKPRKQTKFHQSGVYSGSGFKRRHTRGASAESLNADQSKSGQTSSSHTSTESPARKRRAKDPGLQDYTPQREKRTVRGESSTKRRTRGRRSATPDVPYEPPTEKFTPPKHVVLPLPSSTASTSPRKSRQSSTKGNQSTTKIIRIRPDRLTSPFPLPKIDFSKPIDPPSPTDDPMLLVDFPPWTRNDGKERPSVETAVGNKDVNGLDQSLQGSSTRSGTSTNNPANETVWDLGHADDQTALMDIGLDVPSHFGATFDLGSDSASEGSDHGTSTTVLRHSPRYDADKSTGTHIFHSDDNATGSEAWEDEGEYTGRFKFYSVPVKDDPPSSMTRARRESWGRPISPFPFKTQADKSQDISARADDDNNMQESSDDDSPPPSPSDGRKRSTIPMRPGSRDAQPSQSKDSMLGGMEFTQVLRDDNGYEPENEPEENGVVYETAGHAVSPGNSDDIQPAGTGDYIIGEGLDKNTNDVDNIPQDDSCDEDIVPADVVEISSGDPKVAARAAAILKLHHSYIVDGVVAQRVRRSSPSSAHHPSILDSFNIPDNAGQQELIPGSRRKSLTPSGGAIPHRVRRSSYNQPGSPTHSTISAEDALHEAETELRSASASPFVARIALDSQPPNAPDLPVSLITQEINQTLGHTHSTTKDQQWTKADWKRLDTCFTDERIAVAEAGGLNVRMAEVDDVDIEDVVDRFLVDAAEEWDRDLLMRRATALSARQRAGQGAAPSPRSIGKRSEAGEACRPSTTQPAVRQASGVPPNISAPSKLPSSLLAPRYAHLHEEVSAHQPSISRRQEVAPINSEVVVARPPPPQSSTELPATPARGNNEETTEAPPTAPKRVLNYLQSFLGRGPSQKAPKSASNPTVNALPLPPPEMRQTARGPVTTPAKKPIPRSKAPRELVQLTETQVPLKPLEAPKTKSLREEANLKHVDPPQSAQRPRTMSMPIAVPNRTRKDSGGSVKDLIRSFEEAQRRATSGELSATDLRSGSTSHKVPNVGTFKGRAPWKP